jgi:retinol dehydrogenase 12
MPGWQKPVVNLFLKDPIWGAYTELYGGLSSDISLENNGAFSEYTYHIRLWLSLMELVSPWGKIGAARKDIEASSKPESEGGTGIGAKFWDWTEEQVAPFV